MTLCRIVGLLGWALCGALVYVSGQQSAGALAKGGNIFSDSFEGQAIPVPGYIQAMQNFEIKTLDVVTNGNTTFADFILNNYATAPKDWVNDAQDGGSHQRWWNAWNGGFGPGADSGTHTMAFQGGGHNDGGNNGLFGFDYNGEQQPAGYVTLDAPSDVSDYLDCAARYADGKPTALHMNHGAVTLAGGRYFRAGGPYACDPGGFYRGTEIFTPGVGWQTPAPPDIPFASGTFSAVYDEMTNKVFIYENTSGFRYAFFNATANTWSVTKFKSGTDSGNGGTTFVHDPVRRTANPNLTRVLLFGSVPANQLWEIDWALEEIVASRSYQPSQSVTVAGGNGGFYDAQTDALWVFGNATSSWSTIFQITNLNDTGGNFVVVANLLSGTAAMGTGVAAGFHGRWVWMPDWRALGFAGAYNLPAQVIKIP